MPKIKKPEGTSVLQRLTKEECARLDAIVKKMPFLSRTRLSRICVLYGLSQIEKDPTILLNLEGIVSSPLDGDE